MVVGAWSEGVCSRSNALAGRDARRMLTSRLVSHYCLSARSLAVPAQEGQAGIQQPLQEHRQPAARVTAQAARQLPRQPAVAQWAPANLGGLHVLHTGAGRRERPRLSARRLQAGARRTPVQCRQLAAGTHAQLLIRTTMPQRLTVAGDATARSWTSKIRLVAAFMVIISPELRHSFLLSSCSPPVSSWSAGR